MADTSLGMKTVLCTIVGVTLPVISVCVLACSIALAWSVTAASLFTVLVGVAAVVALVQHVRRHDNRAKVAPFAARAGYEHQALMRGDDTRTGVFGRWQPSKTHLT